MDQKKLDKGIWWDEGVTLVSSCTRISEGCRNCWALVMEERFCRPRIVSGYERLTMDVTVHPERLSRFNTRKPKIFALWNDVFHSEVPLEFQQFLYLEIARQYQHKYIILTKRAGNMERILNLSPIRKDQGNIYHGLTVCTQDEADEKIPAFLKVPGKKFLCLEPMLEEINLGKACVHFSDKEWAACGLSVIVGCETGPGRRPCKLEWVESIIDQCDSAGVPVFVKALSLPKPRKVLSQKEIAWLATHPGGNESIRDLSFVDYSNTRVSKNMSEWPEKFRRRELPWL